LNKLSQFDGVSFSADQLAFMFRCAWVTGTAASS